MDPFESARGENGFSLIEVLIAMFVIAVGVLGTVALIDRANAQTSGTKVRQTANALLRNLLETSQGLPYAQVASATLVSTLQSNGFADDVPASSSTWEIKRNGVTFTIAATACKVDDPSDGQGAHPEGGDFCSDSAAGSGDGNPDDYRRVTLTVTPPAGLAPPVTETTVVGSNRVSNPGGVGAGGGSTTSDDITELKVTAPTLYSGQVAPCSNQSTCTFYSATNSAVTPKSVTLQATTASTAQRVVFAVDGQVMATAMGPATTFTWTWSLPDNQPDGDYIVTAQIYNSTGTTAVSSPSPLIVTVNRYVPDQTAFAPTSAGRNPLWSGVPEVETYPTGGTSARVDRDITGFLASRLVDGSLDGFACQTYSPVVRNCQDVAAPACCDSAVTYRITPTGANPDGSQQVSGITTGSPNVNATNTRPNAPTALVLSRIGSSVTLSWTNPSGSGDPDSGDCIDYFRIYRKAGGDNGAWSYADRVDRTTFGNGVAPCGADATEKSSSLTLLENDSTAKQYRVTAVDTHLAESTMVAVGG